MMSCPVLDAFLSLTLLCAAGSVGIPSPESLNSSITALITNDLQGINSPWADSALLVLDAQPLVNASQSCQALGEQLWSPELGTSSIQTNLDYLKYSKQYQASSKFWIAPDHSSGRTIDLAGQVSPASAALESPVLCTQSAPFSSASSQDIGEKWHVTVHSNNEYITGFRDRLSFRFLGVRYATPTRRFAYPALHVGDNAVVAATRYGPVCVQGQSGSEDCHFLNIWTPYLPGPRALRPSLKPVMFWIHGGAFVGGTGNDNDFDGGNLASRSDVVVVAINYRLGTFGYLALNDGITNGNFGLADQITALDWVRKNIRNFGGDPDRITVFGQSAGAASVRGMIASRKAIGKFAAAILLSTPGGINFGTPYSKYMTIGDAINNTSNAILTATNCASSSSPVDCLRSIPATTLSRLESVASNLVVDGTYLVSAELKLEGPRLPLHLMMGATRDDGAAIIEYPETNTNKSAYLEYLGFKVPSAKLFPIPNIANKTLGLFNMTVRLATNGIFRCLNQATVYTVLLNDRLGSIYYYEFNRTYQLTNWPQRDICEPPKSSLHPFGDPEREYFKCHSGELYYLFGNIARKGLPMRDAFDLPFMQFIVDAFSSFARSYDPNPSLAFLRARGYANTTRQIKLSGVWKAATKDHITKRILRWPSVQNSFSELEQCEEIGLPLNYFSML